MDIYSKKLVPLTQKLSISPVDLLKFRVVFPMFEKDLEYSSQLSFKDLLINLSSECNRNVYGIRIGDEIITIKSNTNENISFINNKTIITLQTEKEQVKDGLYDIKQLLQ